MFWLAVLAIAVLAVVLAVGVGVAAYTAHLRDNPTPRHAEAAVGRHRPDGRPAAGSVAGLRRREYAEDMLMYPDGKAGRP